MTCMKCGSRVFPGSSVCETCNAPVEFPAAEQDRMAVDIRARVLWGDQIEEIRADWLAKGAPPEAVRVALEASFEERQCHFRKRGLQDLLLGIGALAVGGAGAVWSTAGLSGRVHMTRGEFRLSLGMTLLLFLGLFLTIRGVHRLLTGGAAEKSASDLSELD